MIETDRPGNWRTCAIRKLIIVAAATSWLTIPAHSQGFSKKGGGSPYPADTKPKVDEKAYKAALERIPEPNKKYDPWGVARPADPAGAAKKPN
jgi:hypothetical protein